VIWVGQKLSAAHRCPKTENSSIAPEMSESISAQRESRAAYNIIPVGRGGLGGEYRSHFACCTLGQAHFHRYQGGWKCICVHPTIPSPFSLTFPLQPLPTSHPDINSLFLVSTLQIEIITFIMQYTKTYLIFKSDKYYFLLVVNLYWWNLYLMRKFRNVKIISQNIGVHSLLSGVQFSGRTTIFQLPTLSKNVGQKSAALHRDYSIIQKL